MHNSSPIYYSSLCQILGALLVLSGCSSESPPMASGSPDEFYAALLSKRCELAFACTNLGSEGSVLPQVSGSRAGCEELLAQTGGYGPRGLPTASTTTGLAFNSDKAQACIDAMTCGTVLDNRMPVACREVFDGAIAEHGDCEIDAECHGPNMYCREATPDACGGTCEASSVALGESCSASEECFVSDERSEVVCHFDSDGAACRTPQDVVSMAGETCGRTRVGTTVTVAKCATGLDCVSAIGGDGYLRRCLRAERYVFERRRMRSRSHLHRRHLYGACVRKRRGRRVRKRWLRTQLQSSLPADVRHLGHVRADRRHRHNGRRVHKQ
jgi:hypothetical protein